VKTIEDMTGLKFPGVLEDANTFPGVLEDENTNSGTVANPVMTPAEMINDENEAPTFTDNYPQVFIAAACINASGDERANEWVSIANYSPNTIDMTGWTLSDTNREPYKLSVGQLESGKTILLKPLKSEDGGQVMLGNSGGTMRLQDKNGQIVDRVQWTRQSEDGSVNVFLFQPAI